MTACAPHHNGDPARATTSANSELTARFEQVERRYQCRLGVYVPATGAAPAIACRADERFAFCSTFKAPLVAAVLQRNSLGRLDEVIAYTSADIIPNSPVTEQHIETGMTVGQLCDAAIRYSDNAAANLLLADLGGPAAVTGFLRGVGDNTSRLDNGEPELNRNPPDDERDTTTPHAIALTIQGLVLGDALPPERRALLTDWMTRNTTGGNRIRAAFPAGWRVADKTGTGDYGRTNDVAVVWPPTGAAHVIAIYSDVIGGGYNAQPNDAFVADAARIVASALGAG